MLRRDTFHPQALWKVIVTAIFLGALVGVAIALISQWLGVPVSPAIAGALAGILAGVYAGVSRSR